MAAAKTKLRKRPARKKAKARAKRIARRRPGLFRRLFRWFFRGVFFAAIVAVFLVLLFAVINPPRGVYMWQETARLGGIKRDWTRLEDFPAYVPASAVAAEDANFCLHYGFDVQAIRDAIEDGGGRGGSTISQQVAKNVFLWHGRTWLRKGLEVGFTALIELFWSKERIVEVYINVAEVDEGVFGMAAGSQHYFGVAPDKISPLQAARMAAILPAPKKRSASRPSSFVRKKTRIVMSGAETILADGRAGCFTSAGN